MRERGYYWVRHREFWEIAEWERHLCEGKWHCFWTLMGIECTYHDSDFDEIDERKIERQ